MRKTIAVLAALMALALAGAGCGGDSEPDTAGATTATAGVVRAYEAETQGYAPAMRGWFLRNLCDDRFTTAECKCIIARSFESRDAYEFNRWTIDLIRRDTLALGDYNAFAGECA